jgi:nitroimidazol reductase NimA-like FMN-containing flavoprotein (pyridoxamine 5'-phosphate oxidase superfamily)
VAALSPLEPDQCLALLASVPFGRVVFTHRALPAIRPVNHLVDQGHVIIRSNLGSGVGLAAGDGMVVAYEADSIDAETRSGWSVVVTGVARLVADPAELARYERLLRPWVDGRKDCVIRIPPDVVTGYELSPSPEPDGTAGPGRR